MSISSRISSMEEHVANAYNGLAGLGADLTGIDKNIDNIASVLDDIYNDLPKVTDEDTSITLDNTRVGKLETTLKGNTSQTGTPTPSSPIPVNVVSGDNSITIGGENYYTINTAYKLSSNIRNDITNLEKGITYYFNSGNRPYTFIQIYKTDDTYRTVGSNTSDSRNELEFTLANDENKAIISFYGGNYTIQSLDWTNVYLYKQRNPYNIDLPTENKFDISKITENTYLSYDGATGASSVTNLSDYMQILPSKPCTISYAYTTLMNTSQRSYCWYNESKAYISGSNYTPSNTPITITAPSNAKYIRFAYDKNCTNIQLQQSSKATSYGTTPIELCKIGTYQDYFYKDSDKWYLHKEIGEVVLNGSESWNKSSTYEGNYYCQSTVPYAIAFNVNCFSNLTNIFWNSYTQLSNGDNGIMLEGGGTNKTIDFKMSSISTLADFKTFLSNNNLILYYVLATPTNEEITYQPLIDQLNLLEKAMSKDGQTNISQVNNDLPFIISASALKEWSDENE